jgi:hypothetical protein
MLAGQAITLRTSVLGSATYWHATIATMKETPKKEVKPKRLHNHSPLY